MVIGIDAANIRGGGGLNHLVELLRVADPRTHGFSRVIVWSGDDILKRIEDRPWLVKSHQPVLDKGLLYRALWQSLSLGKLARAAGCDVLYVPGGSSVCRFHPLVAFSQNLLPFDWHELTRGGWSGRMLKFAMLRITQSRTFRRADGVVFLTRHARDVVMRVIKYTKGDTTVIPYGIEDRFSYPPREQWSIDRYSIDRPFHLLYVSVVDMYKHQWHVVEAVARLRRSGLPVVLDLVGPAYPPALKRLEETRLKLDPAGEFVRYSGAVPHDEMHQRYMQADVSVFASSCESFGQIVTEAMRAGLPIACSNRAAMPELLGDAAVYFDPENPEDIASAVKRLIESPELRAENARAAFENARQYSWQSCADKTFLFLRGKAHH